jgi:hypothetical protein
MAAWVMGPELAHVRTMMFVERWNINKQIEFRGRLCLGSYDLDLLDEIKVCAYVVGCCPWLLRLRITI